MNEGNPAMATTKPSDEALLAFFCNCPGSVSNPGDSQAGGEFGGGAGQGFDEVPALFFRRRDYGSEGGEVLGAVDRAEAAGDFLLDLGHANVALALVV